MPPHTISSQRLFYRNLFSSPDNHQARTTIMRRFCSDRMCCLMSILLLFYIGWTLFNPSKRALRYEHDSSEQFAYVRALNTSSSMIQNAQLCSLDKVDLLLLIISSSSHFLERQAIRETWGSMVDIFDVHSQRLFVIGYHPNGDFYKDLTQEAAHERDLLYLTTNDYASTLKEIHAYQWLDQYCPNVTYIFKTEDDLFVNSLLLHELVRELRTNPSDGNDRYLYNTRIDALFAAQNTANAKRFLFGLAYIPGRPERNLTSSPYYVPHTEYSNEFYPRYCSGFGYLMNSPTKHALTVEALKDQHPFRFAAIYLTGIVPERLNFICELIPFNFHQGTVDRCVELIKTTNTKNPPPSTSPLLTCSTGRHVGQNSFADYYRLWTDLKHVYVDRLQVKGN